MTITFLRRKAVLFFFGVSGLLFAVYMMSIVAVIFHFSGNAAFPMECAVVFGAAVREGDEAGPGIYRRVETAVHLYKEGSVRRLFFTGGLGEGNLLSEARVMREAAIEMGADPEVISLEERAASTWQNIEFVQSLVSDCESVVGISDRYHLARIRLIAWLQDVPMQVYPAERRAGRAFELVAVPREALGILIYLTPGLRGIITE